MAITPQRKSTKTTERSQLFTPVTSSFLSFHHGAGHNLQRQPVTSQGLSHLMPAGERLQQGCSSSLTLPAELFFRGAAQVTSSIFGIKHSRQDVVGRATFYDAENVPE